jgi:signal transduction histidine kinase
VKPRTPLLHRISLKAHLALLFTGVATIPIGVHLAVTGWPDGDSAAPRAYAGLGVGLLLAMAVGLYLALRLTQMLRRLLAAMDAVAAGEFERRAELTEPVVPAEILLLQRAFNRMSDEIARSWSANQVQLEQIQAANAQLAQLDQVKSDLIDAVSHEFRTPLTSIKGYAATLLRKDAPFDEATRRRLLKVIKDQADRLSRLVDDLLTIPKLDKGELRLDLQAMALADALEPTMALFPDRPTQVTVPEALPAVFADPDRLEQVLVNLIENAHTYSPAGAVVEVRARVDGPAVVVQIHNPCEPIDPEHVDHLFRKFYRVDNTLTRTTRGTGLGLYLTRGLVEAMGGQISASVESGFTVHFTLPVAMAPERTPPMPPAGRDRPMHAAGTG